MTRCRFMVPAGAIVLVLCSLTSLGDEPFSKLSYDEALAAAKKDGKIVLIDFYTTWCGPCKRLDETTWKDEKVRKWLAEKTIALKIDAEKETTLAKKLEINAYPTIVLLKPDETEIDRLVGYRDAGTFLSEANDSLAGKTSVARAKEKLEGDDKDNPSARMDYADALVQKGQNEEALNEYLWCFDHGRNSVGFGGVRGSFLLSRIVRLGRSYPPAIKALRDRRDEAKKKIQQVMASKKSTRRGLVHDEVFEATMDFKAINRELGDDEVNLALFDELGQYGSRAASCRDLMLDEVLDLLIEARRYEDIVGAAEDPIERVTRRVEMYQDTVKRFAGQADSPADFMKKRALEEGGKYYEAAAGAERAWAARAIARRLVALDKSGETYAMLIGHAVRAKAYKMARKLVKQAEQDLSEEELDAVYRAAKKVPKSEESAESDR
jgi:thiol-disulfide isomerase/thioredoxin